MSAQSPSPYSAHPDRLALYRLAVRLQPPGPSQRPSLIIDARRLLVALRHHSKIQERAPDEQWAIAEAAAHFLRPAVNQAPTGVEGEAVEAAVDEAWQLFEATLSHHTLDIGGDADGKGWGASRPKAPTARSA